MAYFCPSRALQALAVMAMAVATAAGLPGRAVAGEPQAPPLPSLEIWSGGQAFGTEWSVYTGASWAPFGSVRHEGVRLRAVLGGGGYPGGSVAFADLLIGYHKQQGPVTLKLLAGITFSQHTPSGPTSLDGTALGPKVLLETWWTISPNAWASLDLGFAMPFWHMADDMGDALDAKRIDCTCRLRVGWKIWRELSLGVEGGSGGPLAPSLQAFPPRNGTAFAGGFLRYEWSSGEVSLSGGTFLDGDDHERSTRPFGTVSVLTRF
jgi:hypothetical protein